MRGKAVYVHLTYLKTKVAPIDPILANIVSFGAHVVVGGGAMLLARPFCVCFRPTVFIGGWGRGE